MTNPLPVPLPKKRDAVNRAVRTFFQGLWVDVAAAVVGALMLSLSDIHWTKAWGIALVTLLVKTAATSAASYLMRLLKPPPSA